ncbi:MAG: HD-GYP domain-containing protein [Planctomycetaceae bacterium]|nr:HD-GYP domain-containing protein [Planctomycetaceae bacterium]
MPSDLLQSTVPPRNRPLRAETARPGRGLSTGQARRFRQLSELTRLELMAVDIMTGRVLDSTGIDSFQIVPGTLWRHLATTSHPRVVEISRKVLCCAIPLPEAEDCQAVAMGFAFREPCAPPSDLVLASVESGWSQERLNHWVSRQHVTTTELLRSVVDCAWRQLLLADEMQSLRSELTRSTERLEQTYEEINLLHGLAKNLQFSRSPLELSELCMNRLHGLIRSEGTAIWIEERRGGSGRMLIRGRIPFDELGLARILAGSEAHDWSQPLVLNDIERSCLGHDFPGLHNLAAAPIGDASRRSGWIVSVNLPRNRSFGMLETSVLGSVSTILGSHVRNLDLKEQQDEMLLSFVRSLVSTLDAKDAYTRGHSERVALVARRLAIEMTLPEADLHDIYLSGLLHDIGKIGVDDRLLHKVERLSADEFEAIKQHPMLGYTILVGLKDLRQVLLGVRNHHERYDGLGYPDGLKGEEIPLMARILAVADSFDAMQSNRSYRDGMPLEETERTFREQAGKQWDPQVIEAYFACREEVHALCANWRPNDGTLLSRSAH